MTIRTRLTFWYAGILIVSLLVIGVGTYREIVTNNCATITAREPAERRHRRRPAK